MNTGNTQTRTIITTIPIPDRKNTDRFGNPLRWILKVIEPAEFRGMIAFPHGFEVDPRQGEYIVEVVKRGERYLIVKLHDHEFEEIRGKYTRILRCRYCGHKVVEELDSPEIRAYKIYTQYEEHIRRIVQSRWYYRYVIERLETLKRKRKIYGKLQSQHIREYWIVEWQREEDAQEAVEKLKRYVYPCKKEIIEEEVDKIVGHGVEKETRIEWRYKSLVCKPVRDYDVEYYIFSELARLAEEEMWRTIDLFDDRIMIHNTSVSGLISLRSLIPFSFM